MSDDILSLVTGGKQSFLAARPARNDYSSLISSAEAKYGIPAGLLAAVITKGERSGAKAVSPKGAQGLGQLMPGTAREMGVTDPMDAAQNIEGSAKYLAQQLAAFNNDPKLAAAAYNAGPGAVKKYGGVPPYKETQAYVQRVTGASPAPSGDVLSLVTGGKQSFASAPSRSSPNMAPAQAASGLGPAPALAEVTNKLVSPPRQQPRTLGGDLKNALLKLGHDFGGAIPFVDDPRANIKTNPLALPGDVVGLATPFVRKALEPVSHAMFDNGIVGGRQATIEEALQGNFKGHRFTRDEQADSMADTAMTAIGMLAPERGPTNRLVDIPQVPAPPPKPKPMSSVDKKVVNKLVSYMGRDKTDVPAYRNALTNAPAGALPYDLAGTNVRMAAEAVAQSPGPGATTLREASGTRKAGAVDRVKGEISSNLGGNGTYFDTLDALVGKKMNEAQVGMSKIGSTPVPLDENSVTALRSDLAQGAIKNEAKNLLASMDPYDRNVGAMLNGLHEAVLDNPAGARVSVENIQNISKALRDAGSAAYKSGDNSKGAALSGLGKALRQNARDVVPEYDKWLKDYSDASGVQDAMELGRNIFVGNGKVPFEQLQKQVADMSNTERLAYQKGVGEALFDQVRQGKAPMRDLLKSEDFGDRVRLAFPNDKAYQAFLDFAKRETGYSATDNTLFGNSRTDLRRAVRDDLAKEPVNKAKLGLSIAETILNPQTIPFKLAKVAAEKWPRTPNSLLTNDATNARLGEVLSDNQKMDDLLGAYLVDKNRLLTPPDYRTSLVPPATFGVDVPRLPQTALPSGALPTSAPATQSERKKRQPAG